MSATDEQLHAPILITVGDPCGIGPEVIHQSLKHALDIRDRGVYVIGDILPFAKALGDPAEMHFYHIVPFDDFSQDSEVLIEEFLRQDGARPRPIFIDLGSDIDGLTMGQGSIRSGELAMGALDAALELIEAGISDTVVTAPISKQWAHAAGFEFPGHTELLGSEYNADPLMVLAGGGLRVALMTIHESIAMVPLLIRKDGIRATLKSFHRSLVRDFGIVQPRIGVCGLNPHAGEGGKFGREEIDVIAPVVADMNRQGIKAIGPLPADSLFPKALRGEFDGVLAMYHDQGLIPVKTLAFDTAVNFTANLPIIRTSPDHGTAYDIAGKGIASEGSMKHAIEMADMISRNRNTAPDPNASMRAEVLAREN